MKASANLLTVAVLFAATMNSLGQPVITTQQRHFLGVTSFENAVGYSFVNVSSRRNPR